MNWPSWRPSPKKPPTIECECPNCGQKHERQGTFKTIKARGVGRDGGNPRGVVLYFDRQLTNDELRALHDQVWTLPS